MAESNKKEDNFFRRRALDVKFDADATVDYQQLENIGIGAYGVVCSAIHKKTNDKVAIKKIPNVFDVQVVAKRTYREIKILKHFKHDNIIHIREVIKPKETLNDFRDVYVVFDLMESDLHKIIYSKQELTEEHVRYFLYQILRGLKYIHSAHVIHRDLKPSNLLVNEDCQLRIGDFGMARGFHCFPEKQQVFMTQYVATRWYRAPELMLSVIEYGAAVDTWSVGCIFAEMLGRIPIFPGKNDLSQIKLIVDTVGTPDYDLLQLCHSQLIKSFFQVMGQKKSHSWQKLFPKASKKAINLLDRMLVLNPMKRITVEQALVHPYLNKYHDPDDEPICVPTFNFDFEQEDLTLPQLRAAIHKEIMEYHVPRTPTFSFDACLRPVPKSAENQSADAENKSITLTMPSIVSCVTNESDMLRKTDVNKVTNEITNETGNVMKQIATTKTSEDEKVFKKPLSATNKDNVHVQTVNHLKAESSDVEMLSAKSMDGRQPMSATITEDKQAKENQELEMDDRNKTVSQGIKSLIKAAVNASLKKKKDSMPDEDRPKPITAAMRQKEREDKRKKKKEKTLERKKNEKKKNAQTAELLTNEDRELLQRWAKMQKVNVPIAPRPGSQSLWQSTQTQANLSVQPTISTIQSSSASIAIGQPVPSMTVQGQVPDEGLGFHNNKRNVQQGTLDMLQQKIFTNNTKNSNRAMCNDKADAESQVTSATLSSNQPSDKLPTSATSDTFNVDFSNVPLGDLDFLSIVGSPEIADLLAQNIADDLRNSVFATSEQQFPSQSSHIYRNSDFNPSTLNSQGHGSFLQSLCFQTPNTDTSSISLEAGKLNANKCSNEALQSHQELPLSQSPNNLSISNHFQNRPSPTQSLQNQSASSQFSMPLNQSVPFTMEQNSQVFIQQQQTHAIPFQNQSDNINPGVFMNANKNTNASSESGQSFMYRNQSGIQVLQDPYQSSSNSNSPPALSVNTRHAQMSFQSLFQQPASGPSNTTNQNENAQNDLLVALLTKQLSKSNVEDICPPLVLTPRGSGAGYGVGADRDAFMEALQYTEGRPAELSPLSPLSSSILADWMEVTGSMNIDLEGLEQELQSPMALCYNDLNLYSS